jgi:uncharacterized protein (DUF1501 family)
MMRTGYTERGTIRHPNLGAWGQHYLGKSHDTLPSSVAINRRADAGQGFFPTSYAPLALREPQAGLPNASALVKDDTFQKRYALLEQLDKDFEKNISDSNVQSYNDYYDGAVRLMQSKDVAAFDLSKEPASMHEAYGKSNFGQGCLLARRLVAAGVRFVEVVYDGWDWHQDITDIEDFAPTLDQAYSALLTDLAQQGLLDSTLVVLGTEFGRKPHLSGKGRGHYPLCFSTVLAGGGVKGGTTYGASDETGATAIRNEMTIGDFHATIGWAAGMDIDKPATAPNGRPFTVGDKGKPQLGVFA